MTTDIRITGKEIKEILKEYEYNPDIFNEEDERLSSAKKALGEISEADRIIYCLWLDLESSRKVGKILGVSHSTVLKELKRIKNEILEKIC